jgi:uncharacterized protein with ParB-like and HNH nuclease domain
MSRKKSTRGRKKSFKRASSPRKSKREKSKRGKSKKAKPKKARPIPVPPLTTEEIDEMLIEEEAQYLSWTADDWREARRRRLNGESDLREGEGWAP